MSGEPSIRLTVPSGLMEATALAGPLPLNQAPPATPRPRSLPSSGSLRCGCSRAASSSSRFPMRWKRGPATCRVPSSEVFSSLNSIGSMSSFRASSSTTCSAAKAAAGEPGARYAADFCLFTSTSTPSTSALGMSYGANIVRQPDATGEPGNAPAS